MKLISSPGQGRKFRRSSTHSISPQMGSMSWKITLPNSMVSTHVMPKPRRSPVSGDMRKAPKEKRVTTIIGQM